MKKLIATVITIMSFSVLADCHVGEMQCSTSCYVEELGEAFICQQAGGNAYCDSDTGYCDVDVEGEQYQGEVISVKKISKNRRASLR